MCLSHKVLERDNVTLLMLLPLYKQLRETSSHTLKRMHLCYFRMS